MAGIYLHIPYCKQACSYCDFYFSTSLASKPLFLQALEQEINAQKDFLNQQQVSTLYFGGGTPSILTAVEMGSILNSIRTHFEVNPSSEITLEANPENLSDEYLDSLLALGINRLSIGLQSFKSDELEQLNRSHTPQQNIDVVKAAQRAGFTNITVDLIYGTPWTNETEWENHVQEIIQLGVQHVSCYQLTIEEKTELNHRIQKGLMPYPDDERTEKQFLLLIDVLRQAGFIHYEVSNFGKPGFFSQHNTSYWKDVPYLGLGPSAHSYNGQKRYVNVPNIHQYHKAIGQQQDWFTIENLSARDKYNDLVLTGLRTVWGVDIAQVVTKLDQSFANYFQRKAQVFLDSGQMIKDGYRYILTEKAFLFADRISADLFYI